MTTLPTFVGGGPFSSVLTSTDDGLSWTDISGTVTPPVYALATSGDTLYAATNSFVHYTFDLGQTWTVIPSDGIVTAASFRALMVEGDYIYAGMINGAYRRVVPGTTSVDLIDNTIPDERWGCFRIFRTHLIRPRRYPLRFLRGHPARAGLCSYRSSMYWAGMLLRW